jgi:hypothetical protein
MKAAAFLNMWLPAWLPTQRRRLKVNTHEILEKTKVAAFLNKWLPAWLANSEKALKDTHT